jgi:hypothetical protein
VIRSCSYTDALKHFVTKLDPTETNTENYFDQFFADNNITFSAQDTVILVLDDILPNNNKCTLSNCQSALLMLIAISQKQKKTSFFSVASRYTEARKRILGALLRHAGSQKHTNYAIIMTSNAPITIFTMEIKVFELPKPDMYASIST